MGGPKHNISNSLPTLHFSEFNRYRCSIYADLLHKGSVNSSSLLPQFIFPDQLRSNEAQRNACFSQVNVLRALPPNKFHRNGTFLPRVLCTDVGPRLIHEIAKLKKVQEVAIR